MPEQELSPQKRGAIKRKENKEAKRRSEIADKIVQSRKDNKAKKKRSEAGKKGVAARRAKKASKKR